MSTTFGELKTRLAKRLQDPNGRTFTDGLVEELLLGALTEVGRIAPEQFTEDIPLVADQLSYIVRYAPEDIDVLGEADTNLFTAVDHGLHVGSPIIFTELTGGTGLNEDVIYWVVQDDILDDDFDDTFKVSTSLNGSVVNFTTDVTATSTFRRYGSASATPEIEVMRVEVWDPTTQPETFQGSVVSAAQQPLAGEDSGWFVWNGVLYLPTRIVSGLHGYEDLYVLRVWGYSPYLPPAANADVMNISKEIEQAMLWYCEAEALQMLLDSRSLFTQWQTRSGNTDISPAGLASQKNLAESMWRQKSRALTRLRSAV